ncbi:hypothetical protein FHT05_001491 [Xanthomonas arboricola]|nr:hypothetical protein [Xanthomonas arboricola]
MTQGMGNRESGIAKATAGSAPLLTIPYSRFPIPARGVRA